MFEALTIIAVLIILACAFVYIGPSGTRLADGESRVKKAKVRMKEIMKALELYKQENGNYPSVEQGLMALVKEPADEPKPGKWRPYIDEFPINLRDEHPNSITLITLADGYFTDPWNNKYIYISPGADYQDKDGAAREKKEDKIDSYDLKSKGYDGIEGTRDDINSWDMDAVCD